MTKREKILLFLIKAVNQNISEDTFTQYAFLISQDNSISKNFNFYEFIVTDNTPRSILLSHDLAGLNKKNHIKIQDGIILSQLSTKALSEISAISLDHQLTILDCLKKANGNVLPGDKEPSIHQLKHATAVYTVGYEGESVDHFFRKLLTSGIKGLIDVRNNPISRKYGFSKKAMKEICASFDIEYHHFPEVGIPNNLRKNLKTKEDYADLLDKYEKTVLSSSKKYQDAIFKILSKKPSALVCFEADPDFCHRSRLAGAISKGSAYDVIHL